MRTRLAGAVLAAVATALVFAACRDAGVTAPLSPTSESASLLGLTGAPPITRNTPLANDVTWSFTVGSGGTVSSNSAVGLTINVPAGALSAPTTITVTALAGAPVAYQFEPHGTLFARKVTLTQKLQGTSAGSQLLPLLQGAYFPTDEPIIEGGLALVSELLSGLLNPLTRSFSFGIEHFSGYIVVSGRGGSAE
jgi:hypothetical protein